MFDKPSRSTALVVGGGTMGADVALMLARAGFAMPGLFTTPADKSTYTIAFGSSNVLASVTSDKRLNDKLRS